MSKKQKTNKSGFSYTAQHKLPKLVGIKTSWDLSSLFYTSENDPAIEKDVTEMEAQYVFFIKKYKNKDFTSTVSKLKKVLFDFKVLCNSKGHKPLYYLSYRQSLNGQDFAAQKKLTVLEERLTKLSNEFLFFELTLSKIPAANQSIFLNDKSLSEFHFYLKGIFESAKYILSEPEEKILNLKSQTSRSMWVSGTEKILSAATISYKKKDVPLNAALMQFMDLPKKDRHTMWDACAATLTTLGPIAENELNAIITDKKINDELRGYKKPYSATALAYDQNEKSIETLSAVVTTKGYELSKKFYSYKAKLEGKKIDYIDREDFALSLPTVDFKTATTICRDAYYGFNPVYGTHFDTMLTSGQIDVYPKKGKGGGAYCSSGTNTPTLVLLNHTDDFQSVRTYAHEMGHATHADRSKLQSILYDDHSIVTAETASTFFEAVVGDTLMQVLTPKQQIAQLNSLICDKISTIMMCVARFNAELEIHKRIRNEGAMTWQEMSLCLTSHFKAYTGNSIAFKGDEGHLIVAKTHYRMNFYQYSYAFGNIASSIMFKRYKDDASYSDQVEKFLEEGLQLLENDINLFIKLTSS